MTTSPGVDTSLVPRGDVALVSHSHRIPDQPSLLSAEAPTSTPSQENVLAIQSDVTSVAENQESECRDQILCDNVEQTHNYATPNEFNESNLLHELEETSKANSLGGKCKPLKRSFKKGMARNNSPKTPRTKTGTKVKTETEKLSNNIKTPITSAKRRFTFVHYKGQPGLSCRAKKRRPLTPAMAMGAHDAVAQITRKKTLTGDSHGSHTMKHVNSAKHLKRKTSPAVSLKQQKSSTSVARNTSPILDLCNGEVVTRKCQQIPTKRQPPPIQEAAVAPLCFCRAVRRKKAGNVSSDDESSYATAVLPILDQCSGETVTRRCQQLQTIPSFVRDRSSSLASSGRRKGVTSLPKFPPDSQENVNVLKPRNQQKLKHKSICASKSSKLNVIQQENPSVLSVETLHSPKDEKFNVVRSGCICESDSDVVANTPSCTSMVPQRSIMSQSMTQIRNTVDIGVMTIPLKRNVSFVHSRGLTMQKQRSKRREFRFSGAIQPHVHPPTKDVATQPDIQYSPLNNSSDEDNTLSVHNTKLSPFAKDHFKQCGQLFKETAVTTFQRTPSSKNIGDTMRQNICRSACTKGPTGFNNKTEEAKALSSLAYKTSRSRQNMIGEIPNSICQSGGPVKSRYLQRLSQTRSGGIPKITRKSMPPQVNIIDKSPLVVHKNKEIFPRSQQIQVNTTLTEKYDQLLTKVKTGENKSTDTSPNLKRNGGSAKFNTTRMQDVLPKHPETTITRKFSQLFRREPEHTSTNINQSQVGSKMRTGPQSTTQIINSANLRQIPPNLVQRGSVIFSNIRRQAKGSTRNSRSAKTEVCSEATRKVTSASPDLCLKHKRIANVTNQNIEANLRVAPASKTTPSKPLAQAFDDRRGNVNIPREWTQSNEAKNSATISHHKERMEKQDLSTTSSFRASDSLNPPSTKDTSQAPPANSSNKLMVLFHKRGPKTKLQKNERFSSKSVLKTHFQNKNNIPIMKITEEQRNISGRSSLTSKQNISHPPGCRYLVQDSDLYTLPQPCKKDVMTGDAPFYFSQRFSSPHKPRKSQTLGQPSLVTATKCGAPSEQRSAQTKSPYNNCKGPMSNNAQFSEETGMVTAHTPKSAYPLRNSSEKATTLSSRLLTTDQGRDTKTQDSKFCDVTTDMLRQSASDGTRTMQGQLNSARNTVAKFGIDNKFHSTSQKMLIPMVNERESGLKGTKKRNGVPFLSKIAQRSPSKRQIDICFLQSMQGESVYDKEFPKHFKYKGSSSKRKGTRVARQRIIDKPGKESSYKTRLGRVVVTPKNCRRTSYQRPILSRYKHSRMTSNHTHKIRMRSFSHTTSESAKNSFDGGYPSSTISMDEYKGIRILGFNLLKAKKSRPINQMYVKGTTIVPTPEMPQTYNTQPSRGDTRSGGDEFTESCSSFQFCSRDITSHDHSSINIDTGLKEPELYVNYVNISEDTVEPAYPQTYYLIPTSLEPSVNNQLVESFIENPINTIQSSDEPILCKYIPTQRYPSDHIETMTSPPLLPDVHIQCNSDHSATTLIGQSAQRVKETTLPNNPSEMFQSWDETEFNMQHPESIQEHGAPLESEPEHAECESVPEHALMRPQQSAKEPLAKTPGLINPPEKVLNPSNSQCAFPTTGTRHLQENKKKLIGVPMNLKQGRISALAPAIPCSAPSSDSQREGQSLFSNLFNLKYRPFSSPIVNQGASKQHGGQTPIIEETTESLTSDAPQPHEIAGTCSSLMLSKTVKSSPSTLSEKEKPAMKSAPQIVRTLVEHHNIITFPPPSKKPSTACLPKAVEASVQTSREISTEVDQRPPPPQTKEAWVQTPLLLLWGPTPPSIMQKVLAKQSSSETKCKSSGKHNVHANQGCTWSLLAPKVVETSNKPIEGKLGHSEWLPNIVQQIRSYANTYLQWHKNAPSTVSNDTTENKTIEDKSSSLISIPEVESQSESIATDKNLQEIRSSTTIILSKKSETESHKFKEIKETISSQSRKKEIDPKMIPNLPGSDKSMPRSSGSNQDQPKIQFGQGQYLPDGTIDKELHGFQTRNLHLSYIMSDRDNTNDIAINRNKTYQNTSPSTLSFNFNKSAKSISTKNPVHFFEPILKLHNRRRTQSENFRSQFEEFSYQISTDSNSSISKASINLSPLVGYKANTNISKESQSSKYMTQKRKIIASDLSLEAGRYSRISPHRRSTVTVPQESGCSTPDRTLAEPLTSDQHFHSSSSVSWTSYSSSYSMDDVSPR